MATMIGASSAVAKPFTARRAAARSSRLHVVSSANAQQLASRRATLAGLVTVPLLWTSQAQALLLDEDDEEMVEKAKANRKSRLATQRQTTNQFLESEGLNNKKLESELIPVQKAVYRLAQSGTQLEAGDMTATSAALSEPWVADFKKAAGSFASATSEGEKVVAALDSLKTNADAADLKSTKKSFVAVVSSLQSWATAAGVSGLLTGL